MTDIVLRIQAALGAAVDDVATFRDSIKTTQVATGDLRETWKATTAEIIADAQRQIATEKEKVDQIRAEIKVVAELSTTYEKGSEERQLATKREIDLQRRLQAALGETTAVAARSAKRVGGETALERDVSGLGRGAASRSGIAGVGLSALAGPAFIGGAIIGGVLDASVKAVKEEQIAQANLRNALKDTGQARKVNRKELEEYLKAEEHATGFQRDEVMQTLSQLIRSTGSLAKARQEEAIMANVARARNTDLGGAMMLVLRASEGNTGSLKRLGIDIQKVTTYEDQLKAAHLSGNVALEKRAKAMDLAATKTHVMREVTKKFAGDSSAYMHTFGGETAALSNTWHDLEVEIGQKAIPVLTQLFGWLNKEIHTLETSKTVHQDLQDAVDALRWTFNAIKTVIQTVDKVTGGFSNTLKLLLTFFAVKKVVDYANAIDHKLVTAFGNAEASAAGAASKSSSVLANMRNLARMGAISIGVDLLFKTHGKGSEGILGAMLTGAGVGSIFGPEGALVGAGLGLTISAIVNLIQGNTDQAKTALGSILDGSMYDFGNPQIDGVDRGGKTSKGVAFMNIKDVYYEPGKGFFGVTESGRTFKMSQKDVEEAFGISAKQIAKMTGQPSATNTKSSTDSVLAAANYYGTGAGKGVYGQTQVAGLGRALDCSAYVWEVFTRAGLKSFPGVSETQWSTDSGPNWTSQEINPQDAEPGDVVFYNVPHGEGAPPNHVGIVVSGHGLKAMVMQYYTSGKGQGTFSILQKYPIWGVKKFYLLKSGGKGTTGKTGGSGSAGAGASTDTTGGSGSGKQQRSFARSVSQAIAQAQFDHGLKKPSLIAIKAAIDAELRTLPVYLDPAEREAIRHIRELERSLHVGMSATQLARDRAELAKWGKNLKNEIAKQAKEIQDAWSGDLNRISKQMSANWSAKKAAFDAQTKAGLQNFVVKQTPEEKALADFQAQIAAQQAAATQAQLQSDLAAAIASGDPNKIRAAQDAINAQLQQDQLAQLQAAADASRVAADKKTAAAQAAYKKERDAQWRHLQALHDDQVRMFDRDLKLWEDALAHKAKTWQQFLRWLAKHPISAALDGESLQDPYHPHHHHHKHVPKHYAGGIHVRPTVGMFGDQGPEATIPLSGQLGQRAIDQLARAIVSASAGMGGGGGVTVYGTFLGATEKQVGRALEGLVTPAQRRVVRYPAPL